jgi:hypothetical protein
MVRRCSTCVPSAGERAHLLVQVDHLPAEVGHLPAELPNELKGAVDREVRYTDDNELFNECGRCGRTFYQGSPTTGLGMSGMGAGSGDECPVVSDAVTAGASGGWEQRPAQEGIGSNPARDLLREGTKEAARPPRRSCCSGQVGLGRTADPRATTSSGSG